MNFLHSFVLQELFIYDPISIIGVFVVCSDEKLVRLPKAVFFQCFDTLYRITGGFCDYPAAIEQFKEEFGDITFECETKTGNEIIADHHEDEDFIGLAINAPQWDFVIAHEDVHECCD